MNSVSFSLFQSLTTAQHQKLSSHIEIMKFEPNSAIYHSGDYTDMFYGVVAGMVKTCFPATGGKEMVKALVKPSQFFGASGLAGQQIHTESAKTLSAPVHLIGVPVVVMRSLMQENEQLLQGVIQMFAQQLRQNEQRLQIQLTTDVRSRILYFLKENIGESAQNEKVETLFRYGLTQQDIAQMIGATRQTVAIILNDLRKQNLIEFSRSKFILKH